MTGTLTPDLMTPTTTPKTLLSRHVLRRRASVREWYKLIRTSIILSEARAPRQKRVDTPSLKLEVRTSRIPDLLFIPLFNHRLTLTASSEN